MEETIIKISEHLNNNIRLKEKRPGVYQVYMPFYHEDGDMVDIFVEKLSESSKLKISDYGLTLMRLSYIYDLDTSNKEKIFNRIINSNGLNYYDEKIYLESDEKYIYPSLMHFAQTIAKISNMKLYQREVVKNLFFEQLEEVINTKLKKYSPQENYLPLPKDPDYEVDYCFNHRPRPIFLFGVNNPSNARLVTISCLKFMNENVNFKSVVVLENINAVSKKDLSRLMSVSDKEFPSLDDFNQNSTRFFEREYT